MVEREPKGQTLRGETNRLALAEKHADSDFVSELFAERLAGPKGARAWIPLNLPKLRQGSILQGPRATPTVEKALNVGDDLLETMGMGDVQDCYLPPHERDQRARVDAFQSRAERCN